MKNFFLVASSGHDSCFVDHLFYIGPNKTGRLLGNDRQINILSQGLPFDTNSQNFLAPLTIRAIKNNTAVNGQSERTEKKKRTIKLKMSSKKRKGSSSTAQAPPPKRQKM